jgi:uncharacterized protein (TIGR04222 family)
VWFVVTGEGLLAGVILLAVVTLQAASARAAPVAVGGPSSQGASIRAAAGAEHIRSYEVQMWLRRDGSMHVRETIAYDFGSRSDRHGVFRTLPVRFPYDKDHRRVYPLENVHVFSPTGAPVDVEVSPGAVTSLRIGNPDRTVRGAQTYVIRYDLGGVVNTFPDHQELYWNAIGTKWPVAITAATVILHGPAPVQRVACYRGFVGSTLECSHVVGAAGEGRYSAQNLMPAQGMTVVAGFPAGTFPQARPILEEYWTLRRAFALTPLGAGMALGVLALLAGGTALVAARRGRDKVFAGVTPGLQPGIGDRAGVSSVPLLHRDPVTVRFSPPDDLRPGQAGTLLHEGAGAAEVVATMIDLAVRGHLRIEELRDLHDSEEHRWRLVKISPPPETLKDYEAAVFRALFSRGSTSVRLPPLPKRSVKMLETVTDKLNRDAVRRGWFQADPARIRFRWRVYGVLTAVLGVVLTFFLASQTSLGLLGVAVILAGGVVIVLAPRMPARTAKGTTSLAQVMGFRAYLQTAEADQNRFEEGQDLFSRYLPFAIVFGLAERWSEQFADLAGRGVAATVPAWYVGREGGAFDYTGLGHAVHSFGESVADGISTVAVRSSGSSGGSGFSGGGSSGGGGGGGGGSW